MQRRHVVVSYDVTDDRKRTRLARFLLAYCERVQKSVFEGDLAERRVEALRRGIGRLIDREVDSVRLYTLCPRCRLATEVIGTGVYVEQPGDVVL